MVCRDFGKKWFRCLTKPGADQCLIQTLSWARAVHAAFDRGKTKREESCGNEGWTAPKPPWMKLNTDGAADPSTMSASSGGVLRDHEGRWLFGFTRQIGACNAEHAELWSILDGLTIAWSWGITNIQLETDCSNAYKLIAGDQTNVQQNLLLHKIKDLMDRQWSVKINWVPREANKVADTMAKRKLNEDKLVVCTSPPREVMEILKADMTDSGRSMLAASA